MRALVGDGALEYALVAAAFHFVNRMADLLHVDAEVPGMAVLRRAERVRAAVVRVMSLPIRRMRLATRPYPRTFEDAVRLLPASLDPALVAPLRARPHVVEAVASTLAERAASALDAGTRGRVDATVEAALPVTAADAEGFHARPADPVAAFAFVGTRYPARTTAGMIDALRTVGFDDPGILELAIAVADANQWARFARLTGLPPTLPPVSPSR